MGFGPPEASTESPVSRPRRRARDTAFGPVGPPAAVVRSTLAAGPRTQGKAYARGRGGPSSAQRPTTPAS